MEKKKSKIVRWIISLLVLIIVMVIILVSGQKKPLYTVVGILLFILASMISTIFTAYFWGERTDSRSDNHLLDEKDFKSSQRLLRYATAILAFVSLTTTANGMKDFIFESNLLAYLASFAIQSILVVFSLLLCRFFVFVTRLSWPEYIKRLVCYLSAIFFSVTLMVSSLFSYSYIANYAYKGTWLNDREVIIREYLLDAAYLLYKENETQGKKALEAIKENANNELLAVMDDIEAQERAALVGEVKGLIEKIDPERFLGLDEEELKELLDVNESEWVGRFPVYKEKIENLCFYYEEYVADLKSEIKNYNQVVEDINNWKDEDASDLQDVKRKGKEILSNLEGVQIKINGIMERMNGAWRGGTIQELYDDIKGKRSAFQKVKEDLEYDTDFLYASIHEIVEKTENAWMDTSRSRISDEVNEILSRIYLLGIHEEREDTGKEEHDLEYLLEKVNKIAIDISGDKSFDAELVENVIWLSDELIKYSDYINLKETLDKYMEENLRKAYYVVEDGKNQSEWRIQAGTSEVQGFFAFTVTESDWKDIRNEDFNLFYTYLKSLPDMLTGNTGGNASDGKGKYVVADVMKQASQHQRDLLGELTDFEKAYNYMKYQFRVMACFSLFLAVFFDLGAFFVGSFIFATEYFKDGWKEKDVGGDQKEELPDKKEENV